MRWGWGFVLGALSLGCGVENDTSTFENQPEREEAPVDEPSDEIETIEAYVEVYCAYVVACGVWPTQAACVEEVTTTWYTDCSVASVEDLNVCADWLSGLTCEDQGWIDACDNAITCP